MSIKILYYDLETTGTDERKHGIHQISGMLEIDGVTVESFDYRVQPNPKAAIVPEALAVGNVTEEEIKAYEPMEVIYRRFTAMLAKYVDRFNPKDKIYLCGFNSADFDNRFFRAWFKQNGDNYFGAYFYGEDLDARILAAQYLLHRRHSMPNFKLMSVARELGIAVDESRLHDALYDIELTRACYRIVTGQDEEEL
jgi:DNA polymerase-3 subunit epsilon